MTRTLEDFLSELMGGQIIDPHRQIYDRPDEAGDPEQPNRHRTEPNRDADGNVLYPRRP